MGCKPKISFTVQNISKGKFELETSNGGLASGSSHNRRNLVPNRQTASLENENKNKHTNIVTGTTSRGALTPNKRKSTDGGREGGEVRSLICIFESDITKPTWRELMTVESPAKRQRCGQRRPN